MGLLQQFLRRKNPCGRVENFHLDLSGKEIGHKRSTSCKDLIKGSVILIDSRVGNERMPRSIAIEGKWMLRVHAADRHHLVKGAVTNIR
jgi:hypothetical protein